jgi:hypothetical protein
MHGYQPIVIPAATTVVAAQQVASGPPIPPIARIRLYSAEEWEAFTNEWAHSFLQGKDVVRPSGAGDKGVDIAVFDPGETFDGIWDGYQCKHYDNPLRPSDIYVELGGAVVLVQRPLQGTPQLHFHCPPRYRDEAQ